MTFNLKGETMSRSNIIIYSANNCPYCRKAKNYLEQNGFEYKEIDLTHDLSKIDELKKSTGHRTIPLIFVNDQFVGGYSDMIEKVNTGDLILKK